MQIISIVPRLPPATDGVGDYAVILARQLRQDYNIQTHFIVCDRIWEGQNTIDGFAVSKLSKTTGKGLVSLLSQQQINTVLLHYVGYGYAKRGCPTWLIDELENWRNSSDRRKLATMFHEVYAAGRPLWTSAFWLFWLQKKLAADLVRLSDRIVTSKQLYSEILLDLSQGKHQLIPAIPVFSNVGEPDLAPCLSQRQPWLVVFGGSNSRRRAYLESASKISHICRVFGIEKIIDIGTSTGLELSDFVEIPVIEKGKLSVPEIQEIFLNSQIGFIDYNPDYLAKSGIFAAYCAHRMLIISTKGSGCEIDDLESGRHYLVADSLVQTKLGIEQLQAIANNAYSWYQTHNLVSQAHIFAFQICLKHQLQLQKGY